MAKVTISLPDEILETIDAEADRRGTTRSGLIRKWAADFQNERSRRRAGRMRELDRHVSRRGYGGDVAECVKALRPH